MKRRPRTQSDVTAEDLVGILDYAQLPLDTEVAPSVGVLVPPSILNCVQTFSVDCHNVIIGANHAT
jgi:hypothetical protein